MFVVLDGSTYFGEKMAGGKIAILAHRKMVMVIGNLRF